MAGSFQGTRVLQSAEKHEAMRSTQQGLSNSHFCNVLNEATRPTCPNLGSHSSVGLENIKIERKDAHKSITLTAWGTLR